jgi:DNA-binding NtrC family response regulator
MNPTFALNGKTENLPARKSKTGRKWSPGRPVVLIATIDAEIREGLADLLENSSINAIWVGSVKDVKSIVGKERIAACLCGFWLQDGTYREVIRHLRRERLDIPAIIVSGPSCPQQYRDYLAAMNLGTLDFLSYPFQKSDFEKMVAPAIASKGGLEEEGDAEPAVLYRTRGAA